jgi:transcription antitermination factor NusG
MSWYVLYTRPYHERSVADQLFQRGFDTYLPWIAGRHPTKRLLLPRHIFVRCILDSVTQLTLISIPGVQRILDDHQGRCKVVAEEEIRFLQQWSTQEQLPAWATTLHNQLLPASHGAEPA